MNIEGYQQYLKQSEKFDEFSKKEIQMLLKMEHDLQIDLDDFIPYNNEYEKVNSLNSMMTQEIRYSERLQFAINRYMRYKIGECDDDE